MGLQEHFHLAPHFIVAGAGLIEVGLPGVRTAVQFPIPDPACTRGRTFSGGVAVIADSWYQAKTAIDRMPIEWMVPTENAAVTTAMMREALAAAITQPGRVRVDQGDVDAGFARAAKIVEATYSTPYLARARMELPAEVEPPVVDKINPANFPIMWIPIISQRGAVELSEFTRRNVKPKMETIDGVAGIQVFGRLDRQIRIWLDGEALRARGLAATDVLDALQDTFVKVFRNAWQLEDPLALRSWVLRVAHSVGLDEFRRRQRLRFADYQRSRAESASVVAPVELRSALREAYRVLSVLPEPEREVFTLRYIDGLELTQIAETCGVSLATVKRRLGRASTRFTTLARRWTGA